MRWKSITDDNPDDKGPPLTQACPTDNGEPTHQGKLIVDATVAEQAIRYPTDIRLLNEARELSEQIIDHLYGATALTRKPRTYRQKARKAYLSIVKQSKPGGKVLRCGIKQQLQYPCRSGCYGATGCLLICSLSSGRCTKAGVVAMIEWSVSANRIYGRWCVAR